MPWSASSTGLVERAAPVGSAGTARAGNGPRGMSVAKGGTDKGCAPGRGVSAGCDAGGPPLPLLLLVLALQVVEP